MMLSGIDLAGDDLLSTRRNEIGRNGRGGGGSTGHSWRTIYSRAQTNFPVDKLLQQKVKIQSEAISFTPKQVYDFISDHIFRSTGTIIAIWV